MDFNNFILFDGAMGTALQKAGLAAGEKPDLLCLTHPQTVLDVHKAYVNAGADAVTTNTFGSSRLKLGDDATPEQVINAAVSIAKQAGAKYTVLDIGPTGALLEPVGTLTFEQAYDLFAEQVKAGAAAGADAILIETVSDLLEAKAALLAAKENSSLPVLITMTYGEDGRTFLGVSPAVATVTLCSLGADAVGINCSLGPKELLPIVKEVIKYATVPVIVQPNAGLPVLVNGVTTFPVGAEEFASYCEQFADLGVSVMGGCCGTTPEHIAALRAVINGKKPIDRALPKYTAFAGTQNLVVLDNSTAIIGERINPTGKKRLKEAIRNKDFGYILDEAIKQQENGADILDVNAGLPDINEPEMLVSMVKQIQAATPLPLQIDSSDSVAVEAAVRVYCGKPIINSVNGKKESMDAILPIAAKYGTGLVALTLDEEGIPATAEQRLEIARKIVNAAESYGIKRENILVDCLVLTASTNQQMVMQTLRAVTLVKRELGVKTVLGVSNVSFGLPDRELINSTFLAAAFGAGLDMPILNPMSQAYTNVVNSFKVLNNEDVSAEKYIEKYSGAVAEAPAEGSLDLAQIIKSGRRSSAAAATEELLKTKTPVEIINEYFIPSLDYVGERFKNGEIFLPQYIASAETVKCGFDVLKSTSNSEGDRGLIVLATVKGDIHDIGKNIVRMLLENYGYKVLDLGKDCEPQLIVDTVLKTGCKLVGLSALMTTTVKYMEQTITALKAAGAQCKVIVGGAVLTEEYAKNVGADYYAKDAAEDVRIAAEIFNN